MDGSIIIWNLTTGISVRSIHANGSVLCLAASPHHNVLAGVCDGSITAWDGSTGAITRQIQVDACVCTFVADGRSLLTSSWDSPYVKIWELENGINFVEDSELRQRSLAGPQVRSGDFQAAFGLTRPQDGINSISVSSDGKLIATASMRQRDILFWDAETGRGLAALMGDHLELGQHHSISRPMNHTHGLL